MARVPAPICLGEDSRGLSSRGSTCLLKGRQVTEDPPARLPADGSAHHAGQLWERLAFHRVNGEPPSTYLPAGTPAGQAEGRGGPAPGPGTAWSDPRPLSLLTLQGAGGGQSSPRAGDDGGGGLASKPAVRSWPRACGRGLARLHQGLCP